MVPYQRGGVRARRDAPSPRQNKNETICVILLVARASGYAYSTMENQVFVEYTVGTDPLLVPRPLCYLLHGERPSTGNLSDHLRIRPLSVPTSAQAQSCGGCVGVLVTCRVGAARWEVRGVPMLVGRVVGSSHRP